MSFCRSRTPSRRRHLRPLRIRSATCGRGAGRPIPAARGPLTYKVLLQVRQRLLTRAEYPDTRRTNLLVIEPRGTIAGKRPQPLVLGSISPRGLKRLVTIRCAKAAYSGAATARHFRSPQALWAVPTPPSSIMRSSQYLVVGIPQHTVHPPGPTATRRGRRSRRRRLGREDT